MIAKQTSQTVDELIASENWSQARALIKEQLKKDSKSHWLLTQLGVTYYEERRYSMALSRILKALPYQPDCPLTLWNLAGCYEMLGRTQEALKIFARLAQAKPNPIQEPCWESKSWAASLQADCLYRIGNCYKKLGKHQYAQEFFESYLNFLDHGVKGLYSRKEVQSSLKQLNLPDDPRINRRLKSILRAEANL